ncbi:hypothetical protein L3X07_10950 [Levilactobacillus brevis]|nr:hypothetical protein [Levilactobacillus brevis]
MKQLRLVRAYLAGLAVGFWPNLATIRDMHQTGEEFTPLMAEDKRRKCYSGWQAPLKQRKLSIKNNEVESKKSAVAGFFVSSEIGVGYVS